MSPRNLIRASVVAAAALVAVSAPDSARGEAVYTSPKPYHLDCEYDYKGLKTRFVSDLWLVIERKAERGYTVKLTGWAYIRQRNASKKLWEDKHWTPFSVTGQVRDGVLSAFQEAGVGGARVKTLTTLSFQRQEATHEITLLVGGRSYKLLITSVSVRLPHQEQPRRERR